MVPMLLSLQIFLKRSAFSSKNCITQLSRQEELAPPPNYLQNLKIPKLNQDERVVLDEPIVFEEIIEAIRALVAKYQAQMGFRLKYVSSTLGY